MTTCPFHTTPVPTCGWCAAASQGAADDVLQVLVPDAGSSAAHRIHRGSGIVGRAGLSPTIRVDFEGNIYNAENLRTFDQRVQHAAGRLLTGYPTSARSTFARHTFTVVGTIRDGVVVITDTARVREWCDQ